MYIFPVSGDIKQTHIKVISIFLQLCQWVCFIRLIYITIISAHVSLCVCTDAVYKSTQGWDFFTIGVSG